MAVKFHAMAAKVFTTPSDVECAKCECCGLTEECTPAYIAGVRERYQGRWICGLCAEAVKDETCRSKTRDINIISTDEALKRHTKFCEQFRSSSPPSNPTEDLISAMKQLMKRTLDSPKKKQVLVFQQPASLVSMMSSE